MTWAAKEPTRGPYAVAKGLRKLLGCDCRHCPPHQHHEDRQETWIVWCDQSAPATTARNALTEARYPPAISRRHLG